MENILLPNFGKVNKESPGLSKEGNLKAADCSFKSCFCFLVCFLVLKCEI